MYEFSFAVRMMSASLEIEKQRENETKRDSSRVPQVYAKVKTLRNRMFFATCYFFFSRVSLIECTRPVVASLKGHKKSSLAGKKPQKVDFVNIMNNQND